MRDVCTRADVQHVGLLKMAAEEVDRLGFRARDGDLPPWRNDLGILVLASCG